MISERIGYQRTQLHHRPLKPATTGHSFFYRVYKPINLILVNGATGQFGTSLINHLLTKGIEATPIAGRVRDVAKAEHLNDKGITVRIGDYTDLNSLVNAFRGVDQLVLVLGNGRGR